MKKFVALCSMVIALTFVVGCSPKAEKPASTPAAESHEGHNHGTTAEPAADANAPAEKPAE